MPEGGYTPPIPPREPPLRLPPQLEWCTPRTRWAGFTEQIRTVGQRLPRTRRRELFMRPIRPGGCTRLIPVLERRMRQTPPEVCTLPILRVASITQTPLLELFTPRTAPLARSP